MTTLYTLAYPDLLAKDRRFIDDFRRKYDLPYFNVVEPHFTLMFGCNQIALEDYVKHVKTVVDTQKIINFCCRYAMLGDDDENQNFYVFLVPDEGYSNISKLHDRLYSEIMTSYLRIEIPYIPHIGIATIADAKEIRALCEELNSSGISIGGSIKEISVCAYDGSRIETVRRFICQK